MVNLVNPLEIDHFPLIFHWSSIIIPVYWCIMMYIPRYMPIISALNVDFCCWSSCSHWVFWPFWVGGLPPTQRRCRGIPFAGARREQWLILWGALDRLIDYYYYNISNIKVYIIFIYIYYIYMYYIYTLFILYQRRYIFWPLFCSTDCLIWLSLRSEHIWRFGGSNVPNIIYIFPHLPGEGC